MKITDRIREKVEEGVNDRTGKVASDLQNQAVEAILAGLGSSEWETYMKNFAEADRPDQLARLTAKDEAQKDPYMRQALAYLVSNAVCGPDTFERTLDKLGNGILDKGLP